LGIVWVLLPLSMLLALASVLAFRWAASDGQLDDLDSAGMRMLFEADRRRDLAAKGTCTEPPSPPAREPRREPLRPAEGRP
jgi:cbb3-type cytochrome oxidase maturation protein